MVTKTIDEFVIFHQNFWQKCAIELKFWQTVSENYLSYVPSLFTKGQKWSEVIAADII